MTVREFASEIDADWDDILEKMGDIVSMMGLDLLSGIVLKTPVDTGRARGNWDLTVGAPGVGEYGADPAGGATISRGQQRLARYSFSESFPEIWISNNLPYIERLEGGYSQQAPNGMVMLTVAEVQADYADIEL